MEKTNNKKNSIRRIIYNIPESFAGKYLKDFLSSLGYSSDLIKYLKQTVGLDAFHILSFKEQITVDIIETEDSENIVPNNTLTLDILYEDADILIINKPSDMPTHPSQGNYENTLGNAVMAHYTDRYFVYRPITRLDRDTSGVCLIAKNRLSASVLSKMMTENLIRRTYIGIVKGNIYKALTTNTSFTDLKNLDSIMNIDLVVDLPIKREENSTIKRVIAPDGEKAVTKITALKYIENYDLSVCKFYLFTGRTHQIRVHMNQIGFPIIGDFLYNPDYSYIKRQALHSNEIILNHPITSQLLRVHSKIPTDMNNILLN